MTELQDESLLMRLFRAIGAENIAWSLRRLQCPVDKESLVLEVGSGGNPYPRADVLLDAHEETRERHWAPLKVDRPTVLGFAEKLPFKNHAFDFVLASHVLEHSADPGRFLGELQRVAKAGYIESPDAFLERINPYRDHRLEINSYANKLIIRKKMLGIVDQEIVNLYENKVKHLLTHRIIPKHPFAFHVRYYWKGAIDFVVLNPEVDASWRTVANDSISDYATQNFRSRMLSWCRDLIRWWLSKERRGKQIDLMKLLICPTCGCDALLQQGCESIACNECRIIYPIRSGIPILYPHGVKDKILERI